MNAAYREFLRLARPLPAPVFHKLKYNFRRCVVDLPDADKQEALAAARRVISFLAKHRDDPVLFSHFKQGRFSVAPQPPIAPVRTP